MRKFLGVNWSEVLWSVAASGAGTFTIALLFWAFSSSRSFFALTITFRRSPSWIALGLVNAWVAGSFYTRCLKYRLVLLGWLNAAAAMFFLPVVIGGFLQTSRYASDPSAENLVWHSVFFVLGAFLLMFFGLVSGYLQRKQQN